MKCAILSTERLKFLREFCNEFEETIQEYEDSNMEEADKEKIIRTIILLKNIPTPIRHILIAYETLYENACDKTLPYLDLTPKIRDFLNIPQTIS
jgi:hypothetical protein